MQERAYITRYDSPSQFLTNSYKPQPLQLASLSAVMSTGSTSQRIYDFQLLTLSFLAKPDRPYRELQGSFESLHWAHLWPITKWTPYDLQFLTRLPPHCPSNTIKTNKKKVLWAHAQVQVAACPCVIHLNYLEVMQRVLPHSLRKDQGNHQYSE